MKEDTALLLFAHPEIFATLGNAAPYIHWWVKFWVAMYNEGVHGLISWPPTSSFEFLGLGYWVSIDQVLECHCNVRFLLNFICGRWRGFVFPFMPPKK
jgi:hypothetical protein